MKTKFDVDEYLKKQENYYVAYRLNKIDFEEYHRLSNQTEERDKVVEMIRSVRDYANEKNLPLTIDFTFNNLFSLMEGTERAHKLVSKLFMPSDDVDESFLKNGLK
jgi:hypothetical protein